MRISLATIGIVCLLLSCARSQYAGIPKFYSGPIYGSGCGITGVDPEPRTIIDELIQRKDTAVIFEWLEDKHAVYQTYAAEAIMRLQRKGMPIPPEQLLKVEMLKNSVEKIYICSGCTHWFEEMGVALSRFSERDQ
jgi:hypothetical protein